jgi:glycosyltransferase involved in cell wall biosynthesis
MTQAEPAQLPRVSVIIPARNEEACLGACLSSLASQTDITFEVIVVNDGSTDRTREIAESFDGVQVIAAPELAPGWIGKNNALVAGAAKARGQWLLFTDADTTHLPGSLAKSIAEASRRRAELLSYSPEQEVHGFWEKAVMPAIFAELAATYRPWLVSDPRSPAAAANGQYLMISREAYDAVGGHALVAKDLLEDVALARAFKSSGRKIFFRYGGDAVRTRMYRSLPQLIEGWTKNLTLLFPAPLRLAALRTLEFVLIVVSITIGVSAALHGRARLSILSGTLALVLLGAFLRRIRRAHFSWDCNVLSLFGLPLFSYLLCRSYISHKDGAVSWKGRTYRQGTGNDNRPRLSVATKPSKERNGLLNPQS